MLRVKSICKQQGISLKELADRMLVSPEAVTRMLSDNGNPTLSTLANVAKALNVQVYELFDDFNADLLVRGYLEVGDKIHRINNFNDLQTVFNKLASKD
ncbi:MAG: helix-turn-helix transcriptional regulator [Prolixibacteraceae bacterium]|nr:helix-turn-helix transcriptional regulator [Prolixibacteraceae bacterium]